MRDRILSSGKLTASTPVFTCGAFTESRGNVMWRYHCDLYHTISRAASAEAEKKHTHTRRESSHRQYVR